jgi:hypothetical protein
MRLRGAEGEDRRRSAEAAEKTGTLDENALAELPAGIAEQLLRCGPRRG